MLQCPHSLMSSSNGSAATPYEAMNKHRRPREHRGLMIGNRLLRPGDANIGDGSNGDRHHGDETHGYRSHGDAPIWSLGDGPSRMQRTLQAMINRAPTASLSNEMVDERRGWSPKQQQQRQQQFNGVISNHEATAEVTRAAKTTDTEGRDVRDHDPRGPRTQQNLLQSWLKRDTVRPGDGSLGDEPHGDTKQGNGRQKPAQIPRGSRHAMINQGTKVPRSNRIRNEQTGSLKPGGGPKQLKQSNMPMESNNRLHEGNTLWGNNPWGSDNTACRLVLQPHFPFTLERD